MTTAQFFANFWPVLVPCVLGFVAVYLLLPRVRRYPAVWGGLLGGLAIIVTGWWLIHAEIAWPETVLFYAFAAIAVVSGGHMIIQSNPVYAALSFAMVILSTTGLFLLQAAPFLMAATIIIYAGAIVVTFLFVIMLAQQVGPSNADQRTREPFLACLGGFVLLAALLCLLQKTYDVSARQQNFQALLDRAKRASDAKSLDAMKEEVANETTLFDSLRNEVQPEEGQPRSADRSRVQEFILALDLAAHDWSRQRDTWNSPAEQLKTLQERFANVYASGLHVFPPPGTVPMDENLPVSKYSGVRPNDPKPPVDAQGRVSMPAQNVAALGQSLFTDYLLAVEITGFLLLVATIGAIAIAARRTEVLR